jgi:hypothetical protein
MQINPQLTFQLSIFLNLAIDFTDFNPWIHTPFALWSLNLNFSIKSLITHQNLIFIQLSPLFDQINFQKLQFNP